MVQASTHSANKGKKAILKEATAQLRHKGTVCKKDAREKRMMHDTQNTESAKHAAMNGSSSMHKRRAVGSFQDRRNLLKYQVTAN